MKSTIKHVVDYHFPRTSMTKRNEDTNHMICITWTGPHYCLYLNVVWSRYVVNISHKRVLKYEFVIQHEQEAAPEFFIRGWIVEVRPQSKTQLRVASGETLNAGVHCHRLPLGWSAGCWVACAICVCYRHPEWPASYFVWCYVLAVILRTKACGYLHVYMIYIYIYIYIDIYTHIYISYITKYLLRRF